MELSLTPTTLDAAFSSFENGNNGKTFPFFDYHILKLYHRAECELFPEPGMNVLNYVQ